MAIVKFSRRHLFVLAVLVMAFLAAFMMRSLPLKYGFYLNEVDPYFNYRATQFLVENGVDKYFAWHDTMSLYPEGRRVAETSQIGLHLSAAYLYQVFGGGGPLYDFVVWFPVVVSSLTTIVMFVFVRVISNTTAGLFASLLFAFSPAIIERGNLGWFKSEPLGLFVALIAAYLFLSALNHKDLRFGVSKAVGGGLALGLAMTTWGGIQYFCLLFGLFFIVLAFFKDSKSSLYVVSIFTILTIIVASLFPIRAVEGPFVVSITGLSLIAPAIFFAVSYFVRLLTVTHKLRNTLAWLGAFVGGAFVFIAIGPYESLYYRYLIAISPFSQSQIPPLESVLFQSVAEHFAPTLFDYLVNFSVLIILAGYGAIMCFNKRNDMAIFALLLGITSLYVSASLTRLLPLAAVAIITLASIVLFEITRSVFARSETLAVQTISTSARPETPPVQHHGRDFRVPYTVLMIAILAVPLFYPPRVNWVASADFPASIANGATVFRTSTNDWTEMMDWIRNNTEPDAVIASWWDYGYWITTLGNRTTFIDNSTRNATKIQEIAKAFISDEQTGTKILRELKADYVLLHVVGIRLTQPDGNTILILSGGGDETKKYWFMKIAGVDENRYLEDDSMTPKSFFWNSTLLGKMFPVQPVGYVLFDGERKVVDRQAEYRTGYVQWYVERVNYPQGSTEMLRLVHASPSFMDKDATLMIGVLLYEVLDEPKPVGNRDLP